jgi:hypothetical protein
MNRLIFLALAICICLTGCNRPLSHPESVDPVYLDLQKDSAKLLEKIKTLKEDAQKAKNDFEEAPIRTSQRQDAEDEYYRYVHKIQKLEENYRYLALTTQSRLHEVRQNYPKVFEEKKPWPNEEEYALYQVEKRLKNMPREWDPEKRIKKRAPASKPAASAAEGAHH